ncbi:MAG: ATP-dependent DNA helicase PcrA [Candidatus Peregrinibacteria bacterium GW2011_GWA2_33_10]|nr:MAG: ATP-dependent DNA helicase PcrA [Candidatus Peregrinibacteria bacterium GW2011_GWA2_33_10]KKP38994.1 MAG: ATP-dependent DNA helicase PcrA, DNA helicase II / ATP-dependent DNA helicase PcrA [Candidatus Peregrinibacteria bacterium GW2011_GWC2_33_13]OGJ49984.1 MAG: hypothetical protein A2229_02890 [Candidatus Peregrinibacteria bacterium RIFOXYA2_FULL_33_7]
MINSNQEKAVKTTDGPVRIIAGPGTGKTFTLISRVEYLIREHKVMPWKILVISFTNKAANELSFRLSEKEINNVNVTTFHSLAAQMLRKFLNSDFKIIDAETQKEILKNILTEDEFKEVNDILRKLQDSKESLANIEENRLAEIKKSYQKNLDKNNFLDFYQLLKTFHFLLKNDEIVRSKCRELFDYIMVDEYQDVNQIQMDIVNILSEIHQNICIVGDPDQTIYSWRGSDVANMSNFLIKYNNAKTIFLSENYRTPKLILEGASNLIKNNKNRLNTNINAVKEDEHKINIWNSLYENQLYEILSTVLENTFGSHSNMQEADVLDHNCKELFCFKDMAILFRTGHQATRVASFLSRKGYPYQIAKDDNFRAKKEIMDFVKILEYLLDFEKFSADNFEIWLHKKIDDYNSKNKFSEEKRKNVLNLLSFGFQFRDFPPKEGLINFLDSIKNMQDSDNIIEADKINLLTLHASKGLEFPIVILWGLEENNLPLKKHIDDSYFLEEERRLMYVGMTRTKQYLHIFSNKRYGDKIFKKSRFINEIGDMCFEERILEQKRENKIRKKEMEKAQMKMF